MRRPSRLHMAVVVVGGTIAVLGLLVLQVFLPFTLGPWGLVVVAFIDLAIYLDLHHRHAARRRARESRRALGGPVGLDLGTHDKPLLKDEFVTTVALLVFVVGIFMQGAALQTDSRSVTNFVLFQLGTAMMLIASLMWWPYTWRFYDWRSESEKYDTTEDH